MISLVVRLSGRLMEIAVSPFLNTDNGGRSAVLG